MEVIISNRTSLEEYNDLLMRCRDAMLYQSSKYLKFINDLTDSEIVYFSLRNESELLAVMPVFIKSSNYGKVINSLPFYGSNGSVIAKNDKSEYKEIILRSFKDYLNNNREIIASTIINSPFESNSDIYQNILKPSYNDERIGQLTPLLDNFEEVFNSFHYKTRNSIRKGEKSGLVISYEDGLNYFDFLFETHKENITSIGGLYKKKKVFDLIKSNFEYGKDYKIFVAKLNNEPVCALLNFYFNQTVEYYTPVIVKEYRDLQPLSAVIWSAMQDAVSNQFKWWNWGGTWFTQKGVYDFKKRWGTQDFNYKYFINTANDTLLTLSKKQILKEFEYFYTVPFNLLVD